MSPASGKRAASQSVQPSAPSDAVANARARVVLAEDFRRLESRFRSSLSEARNDVEQFSRNLVSWESLDELQDGLPAFALWRLAETRPTSKDVADGVPTTGRLNSVLAGILVNRKEAVRLYAQRCGLYNFGRNAAVSAACLMRQAVTHNQLPMRPKPLADLVRRCRGLRSRADRGKLRLFWYSFVVPLLRREHPRRFGHESGDVLRPMRDSIVACALLADLISSEPLEPHMPADWFGLQFGIPADRLRAARRDGRLGAIPKGRRRYLYSVADACRLWPDDGITLPECPSATG